MKIYDMFARDIDRAINGVIKVGQDADEAIEQELSEYVITRELKKHFVSFFNYYSDAFDQPTADTGVWISGFFGSGKSHFLKMLAYLLENREVKGRHTVEWFREKFEDDPATFMLVDRATKAETETILFNIDIEGFSKKDKTAVLRVFAKMFYNHLGFYGENLKVVMLERYVAQQGKTEEFRRVFEEKKGKSWLEMRKSFAFHGKYVIPTLMEVLDMSEEDATSWFRDKTETEISISQLVQDIKAYIDTKPKDFRLLFMADEVGQYVGTDTDLLLNLQSLVEEIGSACLGQAWVVCTGQEAIDEIIKVRSDEFSRIQARFKTRLSLSSSSVDEVIQKRILKKTPEAEARLEELYEERDSELRNLFSFSEARMDIKGYSGGMEFSENFPFVPYQFLVMQKVFAEIRKHGNSGKHLSGGERSMLSGFQEAAQQVKERDEYALVPFYRFYDTVHTFLDSTIRRVIDRCQVAAENEDGIQAGDVNVLKLLYLIRYIEDIPANLENVMILMADHIGMDKAAMRETVRDSLNRLLSQNYIGRTGEVYNFLTDEEQDVQREIRNTNVDTASIVGEISKRIFGDVFTTKKFRYGKYDFSFDQKVDTLNVSAVTGGMCLHFLTMATDATEKAELRLMAESKNRAAIVVLADTPYYESMENALKIEKFVKQRNVSQLPRSVQDIIHAQQAEAQQYKAASLEALRKAIEGARFYVDGEHIELKGGDAKGKLDRALEYLVSHVYSELPLIERNVDSDGELAELLTGGERMLAGTEPNQEACRKVIEYLDMQKARHLPTSMADVQSRYSAIPYGWKEIDIAGVVAQLIVGQRVTIKYAGTTIQPDDPKLPEMLRKKSEIGRAVVGLRVVVDRKKLREARSMLREYFDLMDVPEDEDELVRFIVDRFTAQKEHYEALERRYLGHKYPDHGLVEDAIELTAEVLLQKKDNTALIDGLLKQEDALFDNKEDMQRVEGFFRNQVQIFDGAVELLLSLGDELSYMKKEPEADSALNKIRLMTEVHGGERNIYTQIPQLNTLMAVVREGHGRLLGAKREELLENVRQCMEAIHMAAGEYAACVPHVEKADSYYAQQKQKIGATNSLALLDGMIVRMWNYKDETLQYIEAAKEPPKHTPPEVGSDPVPKKTIKTVYRQSVFAPKTLYSQADVDAYVEQVRKYLTSMMTDCDGIKLN